MFVWLYVFANEFPFLVFRIETEVILRNTLSIVK